jgi:Protein of unknown function (DUF2796)
MLRWSAPFMNRFAIILAVGVALSCSAPAVAQTERAAPAHEHGHGVLNVAVTGKTLSLELVMPGNDVTGFEYEPKTDDERKKVADALAQLAKPAELFALPEAGGCTSTSVKAERHVEKERSEHSEFHAGYEYTCASMPSVTSIDVTLFKRFDRAEELEATIVTDKGQNQMELTRDAAQINLGALM